MWLQYELMARTPSYTSPIYIGVLFWQSDIGTQFKNFSSFTSPFLWSHFPEVATFNSFSDFDLHILKYHTYTAFYLL